MLKPKLPTVQTLKALVLPVGVFVLVVGMLAALWKAQQNNLDYLEQQIKSLEGNIEKLPTTTNNLELKDKLGLEKDLLLIEKDWVNAQNAIYGTLVQTVGGAFFFVTAYFTWRNVRATEEKQVTDRFSKAVEQLQSDKLAVQLGGVYALERIAKDSKRDYWTIMEVLTSFVRANSPINSLNINTLRPISADIQEAITVIGRCNFNQNQESGKVNLSRVNLSEANFDSANFRKVNFRESDLRKVTFGEAYLKGADLRGANLSEANPRIGNLPIKKVIFAEALLSQSNLTRARLPRSDFREADLHKANLGGANLSEATFIKAKLIEADLSGADLSRASFRRANLSGTNLNDADIAGADFLDAEGLNLHQVKAARNWQYAKYSKELSESLGLPSE